MRELHELKAEDLQGLAPEVVAALAQQMLARLREQDQHIEQRDERIERQAQEIRFKASRIEKLTFELARHKAWRFGAKTEAMSAEQRAVFGETLTEDEASLLAQLQQARGENAAPPDATAKRKPRRQPLPDHLRRVEHTMNPRTPPARRRTVADRCSAWVRTSASGGHRPGRVLRAPHIYGSLS